MKWSGLKPGDVVHYSGIVETTFLIVSDAYWRGSYIVLSVLNLDTGEFYPHHYKENDELEWPWNAEQTIQSGVICESAT